MALLSQEDRRPTPWAHTEDKNGFESAGSLQHCCLDEDTVTVVLLQAILRLSAETRRKLLMFMHQADDAERVGAELCTEPEGLLELRLNYQEH
jgi:hypothetical protein